MAVSLRDGREIAWVAEKRLFALWPAAAPAGHCPVEIRSEDADVEVRNPVFILGTGRCGSTILHRILCHHPEAAWLSHLCNKYPARAELNALVMRALDVPGLGAVARRLTYPSEVYRFWDFYAPGFSSPCRDLFANDVLPSAKEAVRRGMSKVISPRRNRLLVKLTGWPRIGFIKEIFPDAKFVVVYRDGRAVATSGFQVPWHNHFQGPQKWMWGELTSEQRERWYRYNKSFLVLPALVWEILMSAQRAANETIPSSDLHEVRYEDLCADPLKIIRGVAHFASLSWTPSFEETVKGFRLNNQNDKWRQELTEAQQTELCEFLSDALREHGYT